MLFTKIVKIRLVDLLPHELYNEENKKELIGKMNNDLILKRPIAVYDLKPKFDIDKYLIIDGHHTSESLKDLGYSYVLASYLDYFSPIFKVRNWNDNKEWNKYDIIKSALNGRLLEPKTTKHVFVIKDKEYQFHDNDLIEPVIDYPLRLLK